MKLIYSYIGVLRTLVSQKNHPYNDQQHTAPQRESPIFQYPEIPAEAVNKSNKFSYLTIVITFLVSLMSCQIVRGQSDIAPLQIGDAIPEELWNLPLQVVNHPEGKEIITLADYKDKLIILDFWATWCAPCIKNFPKLHDLQNEFGDEIKVLAITQDDTDVINDFFTSGAGKEHTYVHSVINDKTLSAYFPHRGIPHIVWINQDGKLLNTTSAEEITKANIQALLDEQTPKMVAKVDIDRDRPLFLSEHYDDSMELKSYSIFSKGSYAGLPSTYQAKKTESGNIIGMQMTNLPMMNIYAPIVREIFRKNEDSFNYKRCIIEVNEPDLLRLLRRADGTIESHNLYSYELIVSEEKADSLYAYLLADLNRYSDYICSIEKRMVDCFVLIRTSSEDKMKSEGGKRKNTFPALSSALNNLPIRYMVNRLSEDTPFIKLPVIDETGYTGNVDIEVSDFTDFPSLRTALNKYDLDLIATQRKLDMLIIKDK